MIQAVQALTRPSVLVFAGLDPGGGAGLSADIEAISALGAHALPVATALTVQDNDRVFGVHPVEPALLEQTAWVLADKIEISAIKIGIVGKRANAEMIASIIVRLRERRPDLPVVLDPVLASGHGDALTKDDAARAIEPLIALATLILPNLPEANILCGAGEPQQQAEQLLARGSANVLIKGGHGIGNDVVNTWFGRTGSQAWSWPRLPGEFHGSGCTLASAVAALLAQGKSMQQAIDLGQRYAQHALGSSYAIAQGQRIPGRTIPFSENTA